MKIFKRVYTQIHSCTHTHTHRRTNTFAEIYKSPKTGAISQVSVWPQPPVLLYWYLHRSPFPSIITHSSNPVCSHPSNHLHFTVRHSTTAELATRIELNLLFDFFECSKYHVLIELAVVGAKNKSLPAETCSSVVYHITLWYHNFSSSFRGIHSLWPLLAIQLHRHLHTFPN